MKFLLIEHGCDTEWSPGTGMHVREHSRCSLLLWFHKQLRHDRADAYTRACRQVYHDWVDRACMMRFGYTPFRYGGLCADAEEEATALIGPPPYPDRAAYRDPQTEANSGYARVKAWSAAATTGAYLEVYDVAIVAVP